jgi:hypothetical protein
MNWQPIETAPKDGRPVLLFVPDLRGDNPDWITARWEWSTIEHGDWRLIQAGSYAGDSDICGDPTHWAALPLGPNGEVWKLPDPPKPPVIGPSTQFDASKNLMLAQATEHFLASLKARNAFMQNAKTSQQGASLRIRLPNDHVAASREGDPS